MNSETGLDEIVIPAERAVFWMDRFGHWCNQGGRFRHKRVIDYFNASIRRDRHGYFVEQIRDRIREKVYFLYEDTPLFVIHVVLGVPIELWLNTGGRSPLQPEQLFVRDDNLYLRRGEERVKFTDRALLKLANELEYDETSNAYAINNNGVRYPIPEE